MGARRARQARARDGSDTIGSSPRDCRARLPSRLSERSRRARSRRGGGRQPARRDPRGAPRGRLRRRRRRRSPCSETCSRAPARRPRRGVSEPPSQSSIGSSRPTASRSISSRPSYRADNLIRPAETVELARRARADRPSIYGDDALGWALARAGRCDEALPLTERALRLGTQDPLLYFHRGYAEGCAGNRAAMRDWYATGARAEPPVLGSLGAGCASGSGPFLADRGRIIGA